MRDEFILIYSRSGSWGTRCLSPATVRPFAAGEPRVWGHSRFSPAAFEKRPAGVSPLRGEVRPQKRFCPLQMCSPHSKPSQPPLGAWRAGRVHPHLFSVCQLGDALSFPRYSLCLSPATVCPFRRRRAACVWGHSRFSPAAFGPRASHLSVQHFTLHQPGQGRQGLSFVAEGAAAHDSVRLHISVWGISPPPRLDGVQLTVVNSASKASVLQL